MSARIRTIFVEMTKSCSSGQSEQMVDTGDSSYSIQAQRAKAVLIESEKRMNPFGSAMTFTYLPLRTFSIV